MVKSQIIGSLYRDLFKPLAFQLDAEWIHDRITRTGELLENAPTLVSTALAYQNPSLKRKVLGIEFTNPVGLSAGFDYDGHLAQVLTAVGFGFNTVGTVTARPYEGNPKPRLARLPKSRSLLVNKGFKSSGAGAVAARLDSKDLTGHTVGLSIGSSNLPEVNSLAKAIDDYLFTFDVFRRKKYISYFELNISCPNTAMTESFTTPKNFESLAKAVTLLKIKKPIFVKMPNEIALSASDTLVKIALKFGILGFIFSNLVKDRNNPNFFSDEIARVARLKGNFSGRPAFTNSNNLLSHSRQKFGRDIALIGCGGIFSGTDALDKLNSGADLVQLITGMIFEGPQLVGEINEAIAKRL